MVITKRLWGRLFFVGEVFCFFGFYLFGAQGIMQLSKRNDYNQQLSKEIESLQATLKELKSSIDEWKTNSFLKEKMAREQLDMARPYELVYMIQ